MGFRKVGTPEGNGPLASDRNATGRDRLTDEPGRIQKLTGPGSASDAARFAPPSGGGSRAARNAARSGQGDVIEQPISAGLYDVDTPDGTYHVRRTYDDSMYGGSSKADRTSWTVTAPDGTETTHFTKAEATDAIRSGRAKGGDTPGASAPPVANSPTGETTPTDTPADRVNAFKGQPREQWIRTPGDSGYSFITPEGGYASVHPDTENTGHWFIDTVNPDGSTRDSTVDDPNGAMREAEKMLSAWHEARVDRGPKAPAAEAAGKVSISQIRPGDTISKAGPIDWRNVTEQDPDGFRTNHPGTGTVESIEPEANRSGGNTGRGGRNYRVKFTDGSETVLHPSTRVRRESGPKA
jgi:hypothetical protein